MGVYNLRVYEYVEGVQIRLYDTPQLYDERVPNEYLLSFNMSDDIKSDMNKEKVHTSELLERSQEQIEKSIYSSRNRTVSKIYEISRANIWEYFLTLTFDRKKLDSSDYDLLCEKVSKWLNNIRSRYAPDLKYLIVPELHKDGIHYHFHGLLSNIGNIKLIDSGVKKKGHTIYNLQNWKYGFSTVSKVEDSARVSSYITKYITKDLCAVGRNKRRYWCSKNCDRAKIKIYNLPYDEIENFLDQNMNLLQHVSKSIINGTGHKITYIEMKKE